VASDEVDQPLMLYHDFDSCTARAATLPATVHEDADSFSFHGSRFVRTGCGIVFWDYLVLPNNDIVGVVFNDFDIDTSLDRSRLLTASSNITRDDYGYQVLLAEAEADIDASQAFGSSLFECNGECVLMLPDWHRRGYAFQLDSELIGPLCQ
jgi:hypothetical protein